MGNAVELATSAVDVPDMVRDDVGREVVVVVVCFEDLFVVTSFSSSSDSNGSLIESILPLILFPSSTPPPIPPMLGLPLIVLLLLLLLLVNGLILPVELYDTPTATIANTKIPKMNAVEKTVTHLDRRLE